MNNAFAYTFQDSRISTSAGTVTEQNHFVGAVSTIMWLTTQRKGHLFTYFDIIDESEKSIKKSSLKQTLTGNHTKLNRRLLRGHLPEEYIIGFCKSFRKLTKGLGFELELRTSNRKQDIL